MKLQTLILLSLSLLIGISAEQCGRQAGGAVCPIPSGGSDISNLVSSSVFDQMLKYRNDVRCISYGFYKYDAFIAAARSFNGFGTTGDVATRKKELAVFLAQISYETTGGWASAPDGPYAWGYCFVNDRSQDVYCTPSSQYPCAAGKQYYGRGPILLTLQGNRKGSVKQPGTAIWFWMTPRGDMPSSHDVITGRWSPSGADKSAGRVPGYGVITNIINGGLECGNGQNSMVASRIGFYKIYCGILGVSPGDNLDCYNQSPFA